MFVRNVMSRKVTIMNPDVTIKEAAKLMSEKRIGSIIILKKGGIAGIVTERDIIKKVVSRGLNPEKIRIQDIMTKDVITIGSRERIDQACKIMDKYHIKKLPVVDNGELVGIITTTDIVQYEPKLAGYIFRLITKKENERMEKDIRTILSANIFLAWLSIIYAIIFTVFLRPALSPSTTPKGLITTLYLFIGLSTLVSATIGIICYRALKKRF